MGDAAEREQEFYEVFGRLVGGLFDDVGDSVGDGGLEGNSAGVEAGEVYANQLAWLEDWFHERIVALRVIKCKVGPGNRDKHRAEDNPETRSCQRAAEKRQQKHSAHRDQKEERE